MLRAARVSILLTVLSDSEFALGVVLVTVPCRSCRWSRLHGARRDTTGNVLIEGHASNEAVDRLAEAGRRRLTVSERRAALISCAQPADSSRGRVMFRRLGRQGPLAPTKTGQSLARKIQRNT